MDVIVESKELEAHLVKCKCKQVSPNMAGPGGTDVYVIFASKLVRDLDLDVGQRIQVPGRYGKPGFAASSCRLPFHHYPSWC